MKRSWKNILEKAFESHLGWSAEAGVLNYDGKQIIFHTIDREILMLCNGASKIGLNIAVVYPVYEFHLLVPITVEILYNLMNSEESKKSVLLITSKLDVRENYKNLKANYMHIHEDVFRLCIIKRDGSYKRMRQRSGYKPGGRDRFFITTSVNYLPNESIAHDINTVVIDLSTRITNGELEHLKKWSAESGVKSIVYIETDPYSDHIQFFKKNNIPVWGWDDETLRVEFDKDMKRIEKDKWKYSNPFSCSVFSISNLIRGVTRRIIEVKNEKLDQIMMDAVKLYYGLKAEAEKRGDYAVKNATYCFLSILFSLERMTAPLKYIEDEREMCWISRTIYEMIEALENFTDVIYKKDELLGSYFSKTKTLCRKIYAKFSEGAGFKSRKMPELIDKAIKDKKRTLVVSYNETYMKALLNFLNETFNLSEEHLNTVGIYFSSLKGIAGSGSFDQCIFFGHFPRKFRYLLRNTVAKEAFFLIYPAEKALLIHQIKEDDVLMKKLFSKKEKAKIMGEMLGKNPKDIEKAIEMKQRPQQGTFAVKSILEDTEKEIGIESKFEPIFKIIANDEDSIMEAYDEQADFNLDQPYSSEDSKHIIDENCVKVKFQDGNYILLRESKMVPVFVDYQNKIVYKKAFALKCNDVVIVINRKTKDSLTSTILEMVDSHPSMKKINIMVKSWVYYLRKGMRKSGDNFDDLLSKLAERGSRITTEGAVYFWERGYVIGPRNQEDIRRIGEIYNSKFLIENYKEVYSAVKRLRSIHQSLLRRLSKAIPKAGVMSISSEDKSEVVDEELDLHLEDFLNVISLHRVSGVEKGVKAEVSKQDRLMG